MSERRLPRRSLRRSEPAVELGPQTEFDPDLVVVRMDQIGGAKFTEAPLLVIEIRSPSTALVDLNRKKAAYERFGVPSYWIVNPDPPQPELTVFELRDGRYALAAKVGAFRGRASFPREHRPGRPDFADCAADQGCHAAGDRVGRTDWVRRRGLIRRPAS